MDALGDAPCDVPEGRATGRATERAREGARRRARGRHGPSHTARATIWRELQLIRAVLHCAASCCAELCCSQLRCGSSYPWHPNPVRPDLDLKLKLPMRMVRPKLAAIGTCGAFNQLELKVRSLSTHPITRKCLLAPSGASLNCSGDGQYVGTHVKHTGSESKEKGRLWEHA